MRNPRADFPNRIREHRRRLGFTLKQLAAKVSCSIGYLSDLERGECPLTPAWVKRLARSLDVDADQLLLPGDKGPQLSKSEQELLSRYRQGTDEQQYMILAIARVINRGPV